MEGGEMVPAGDCRTDSEEDLTKRSYKRFKYSIEQLKKAIDEVKNGLISANKASQLYGIPKGTLIKKLHQSEPFVRKMGPPSVLSPAEEERIEQWILGKAKVGFPMHSDELKDTVQKLMKDTQREYPFINDRPGKKWLELYLKRHPNIVKKNTEILSRARSLVTENSIREWFSELSSYMKEVNGDAILKDPRRIFNLDETGMSTCPKSGKVLGPKKYRNFYEIASGPEKECITVLCTFSASGEIVTPMIVYPYKRLPTHIADGLPDGLAAGRSDNGWMVSGTFYEYVANVFYPWVIKKEIPLPVIVFLDGHKSHINEELYNFCIEKNILIFCLLPNATHILQPCDVAIFRPLKNSWKKYVHSFKQKSNKTVSKNNFAQVFYEAFKAITPASIKNGFKACGIHPLNPDAVDYSKCISKRKEDLGRPGPPTDENTNAEYKIALQILEKEITNETLDIFRNVNDKSIEPINENLVALYDVWDKIRRKVETVSNAQKALEEQLPATGDQDSNLLPHSIQPGSGTMGDNVLPHLNIEECLNPPDIVGNFPVTGDQDCNLLPHSIQPGCGTMEDNVLPDLNIEECLNPPDVAGNLSGIVIDFEHNYCEIESSKAVDSSIEVVGLGFSDSFSDSKPIMQTSVSVENIATLDTKRHSINDSELSSTADPWETHFKWPTLNPKSKKRKIDKMPYAMTSENWKIFNEKKKQVIEDKKNAILKRKKEREMKRREKNIIALTKKNKRRPKLGSQSDKKSFPALASEELTNISSTGLPKRQIRVLPKRSQAITTLSPINFDTGPSNDTAMSNVVANDYVLIRCNNNQYIPGKVIQVLDELYKICEMVRLGRSNRWIWPKVEIEHWHSLSEIVTSIKEPIESDIKGFFYVSDIHKYLNKKYGG